MENAAQQLVELLGVLAFAFSGIIEARKKGMDLVGVYAVSMITAFGGGTMRDLFLGHYPLYWIEHSSYPLLLLGFAIASAPFAAALYENRRVAGVVQLLDATGLGLFSTSGAYIAQQAGCDFFIAVLLGVVTGVFGGIMRDTLCNEIPSVFARNELYASCAFAGAGVFLAGLHFGIATSVASSAGIAVTVLLRLASLKYRLRLPL